MLQFFCNGFTESQNRLMGRPDGLQTAHAVYLLQIAAEPTYDH
jgi:hypothetical protein